MPSYRDLEVYQEAYRLALEVHQLTLAFPDIERYVLADQMRRASKSIPANIAEGYGVQTQRNFARFLSQALGSSAEMGVPGLRHGPGLSQPRSASTAPGPLHGTRQTPVSPDANATGGAGWSLATRFQLLTSRMVGERSIRSEAGLGRPVEGIEVRMPV